MYDVILETIIDSLKMLPFLFGAYFLIEYIEKKSSSKVQGVITGFGRFGTVGGALLSCVPQCGFSAAASNLFANKLITIGTLVSIFVSTSDEAIPILISHPDQALTVLKLLAFKVVIAIVAGVLVDLIFRGKLEVSNNTLHQKHHCCHEHGHSVIISAAKHTINIFLFIIVISFLLNTTIYILGQEKLSVLLMTDSILQPAIAGLIGFIPNCASSVVLTELYIEGTVSFGSIISGLCTGVGIGLAVLFKENNNLKENLKVMGILYIVGVVSGMIIQLFIK